MILIADISSAAINAQKRPLVMLIIAGVYPKDVPNLNLFYIAMTASRAFFLLAPEVQRAFDVDVFDDEILKQHEDAVIALIYSSER